jgi:hypothetical protein
VGVSGQHASSTDASYPGPFGNGGIAHPRYDAAREPIWTTDGLIVADERRSGRCGAPHEPAATIKDQGNCGMYGRGEIAPPY